MAQTIFNGKALVQFQEEQHIRHLALELTPEFEIDGVDDVIGTQNRLCFKKQLLLTFHQDDKSK